MSSRRLFIFFALVSVFSIGTILWYFFFSTPKTDGSLGEPTTALPDGTVSPRGNFITRYFGGEDFSTSTTEIILEEEQPLVQLWNKPSAGNTFVLLPVLKEVTSTSTGSDVKRTIRATSTFIMFIDRTTGHIYGHSLDTKKTYQISNSTIPGIYDSYIFNNGKNVLMRYLDNNREDIVSLLAEIPNVGENNSAQPLENISYLSKNINSVAVSLSSEKISYVVPDDFGSSIYTINKNNQTSFRSSFVEWSLSYGGENLYATSKPSAFIEGITVSLPSFERLVGNKTGLTSLPSPNGTLLNSMWSSSGLLTFLFSKDGETSILKKQTLSSKCSWTKENLAICSIPKFIPRTSEGLPDDWYQGRISFDDSLSLIDPKDGEAYSLFSFNEKNPMDVINVSSTNEHRFISFINKKDRTLWLLKTDIIPID